MQSKGLIRLFAILLALASLWQLSFTAVTRIQEKKAAKIAAERAQQFVDANNVAAEVREFVLDSVANIRNRAYIDSIGTEKVYLGYTYQSAKEKEINPQGRHERHAAGPARGPGEGPRRQQHRS